MEIKPLTQKNILRVRGFLFPFALILISIFLCFKSWMLGTWFSGWDTLHPEFNFGLSFERILNGVFRPDQGLGAVTAHAHISDLPRVIFLFFASIILPDSFLRYFFISLCLILGVLGTYFFIKKAILKDNLYSGAFAFLGALFYLFNLGTLQHFYVPFEMFTVAYAFLPWLFLLATNYLTNPNEPLPAASSGVSHKSGTSSFERSSSRSKLRGILAQNKKNLLWFAFITLLSTPMAFASTLWFAYFLALTLYLVVLSWKHFKKALVLIILTLAINSFWLLPNIYFVVSGNANWVSEAKSNKIFSEEAFSYNQSYGTLQDAVVFRNFLFDWSSFDGKSGFEYLFLGWKDHLNSPQIIFLGYLLTTVALLGLIFGIFSKNKTALALILPSLTALIFLINQNPPLDSIFSLFREKIPLFSESLRFPFTKFSIILMFAFSCFFALGQKAILDLIGKIGWKKLTFGFLVIQLIIFSAVFYVYIKPAFAGDFLSKKVQIKIPQDYFEMFKWFESQSKEGRVANLPINSLFGWVYYSWGFQGAQFISFGIKQPLLDRDFDRWNPENEQYYREMSYAIYSQNPELLSNVIDKYNIKYLLVDENVVSPGPGNNSKSLYFNQMQSLLSTIKDIKLAQSFGKISVWEVISKQPNLIYRPEKFIQVEGSDGSTDIDFVYKDFGTYIDSKNSFIPLVSYPNWSFTDNQNIVTTPLNLSGISSEKYTELEPLVPASVYLKQEKNNLLVRLVFKMTGGEKIFNLKINNPDLLVNLDNYQTILASDINDKDFTYIGDFLLSTKSANTISFYDQKKDDSTSKISDSVIKELKVEPCSELGLGSEMSLKTMDNRSFGMTAKNLDACVRLPLSKIVNKNDLSDYKNLVDFSFSTSSATNSTAHYCLFDNLLRRCVKEEKDLSLPIRINDYFTLDNNSLNNLDLVFYADGLGSSKVSEVEYSNLTLSVKKYSDLITIFPEDIKNLFINQKVLNQNINASQEINIIEKGHESDSCSNILPQNFSRKVNANLKTVEYSSEGGSSCDHFSLPNLPHNTGYLLTIESQNVTGLPLRICLTNPVSKRCDIYVSLPKNKQFEKQTILIPPMNDGGVGYDLHFDNYSTGRIISTNRIRSLSIEPFPYYWINDLHFPTDIKSQPNMVKINSVEEFLPGFIKVNFNNNSDKPGLLVLNRSFENGWWSNTGEHVKVNGWANGWEILPNQQGTIYIFFWPQLLEWTGFVFLIGTFAFLLIKKS